MVEKTGISGELLAFEEKLGNEVQLHTSSVRMSIAVHLVNEAMSFYHGL